MSDDDYKPSPEFLAELEALLRKHNVMLIGADYHAGILVDQHTWNEQEHLKDGDYGILPFDESE